MKRIALITLLVSHAACADTPTITTFDVSYTDTVPVIDGTMSESAWDKALWRTMDAVILGAAPTADDFSGRYKLLWDEQAL